MSQLKILKAQPEEVKSIVGGMNAYNLSHIAAMAPTWTPLEFALKDDEGNLLGGILGGIGYWNGLEIKLLWVAEKFRSQGLGSNLLHHMETEAKKLGATISMLDTFDFQAEGFYSKMGYKPVGEIADFPEGHRRIYFSKKLEGAEE